MIDPYFIPIDRRPDMFSIHPPLSAALPSAPRLRHYMILCLLLISAVMLAGCGSIDKINEIGKAPDLTPMGVTPTRLPQRVALPMPSPESEHRTSNSLWRTGSRAFFKDQRANRVGDILTVAINITDQAQLANETVRKRVASESEGIPNFLGYENVIKHIAPSVSPSSLVSANSTTSSDGTGTVKRQESITMTVAAVVTQVLPNGNLVIEGHQEVRVNFEVRDLYIGGVVNPADISNTNQISHTQIAEARLSYGGRGQLTDVQQPRYGQQFWDIVFPF
jgi:flagellar L-ring protein precursor FlgH